MKERKYLYAFDDQSFSSTPWFFFYFQLIKQLRLELLLRLLLLLLEQGSWGEKWRMKMRRQVVKWLEINDDEKIRPPNKFMRFLWLFSLFAYWIQRLIYDDRICVISSETIEKSQKLEWERETRLDKLVREREREKESSREREDKRSPGELSASNLLKSGKSRLGLLYITEKSPCF